MGNSIKMWPKFERPRELLLEKGPSCVSDAGLVAILLRTGIKGKDAVSLARELLNSFGGLRGLLSARKTELEKIKGLGNAKIAQLMAVIEIAQRRSKEEITGKNYLENEKDVIDYLYLSMADLREEFFKAIYLNKANIVLSIDVLTKGTVDQAAVYPREVVRRGLELGASAIIFVHNHPAGDMKPSQSDLKITKKIISACLAVGIAPLDHIIISSNGHISLRKQGFFSHI